MLPSVRVPVRRIAVGCSKQLEPSTCTTLPSVLPDWLMLPAIVKGGIPAVDVVLNCQLPAMFRPCGVGPEDEPEFEPGVEPGVLSPPHP